MANKTYGLQKSFTEVDIWPFESNAMVDIFRSVFERLGTTPKMHNATGGGVLICTPRHIPEPCIKLYKSMFEDLGVHKLYLACKSALVLHAHCLSEGVVINCGFSNIDVESVMSSGSGSGLASNSMEFASAQIKGGAKRIIAQVAEKCHLSKHHACEFVRQHCFVPLDFNAETENYDANDVIFQPKEIASETETETEMKTFEPFVVESWDVVRRRDLYMHAETALFHDVETDEENEYYAEISDSANGGLSRMIFDQQYLQHMIQEAQDLGTVIDSNVVLSGGLAKLTGLKGRLEQDLEALYSTYQRSNRWKLQEYDRNTCRVEVKVILSECPEYDVWKGGALLALALSNHEWYDRMTYLNDGPESLLSSEIGLHRLIKRKRFLHPSENVKCFKDSRKYWMKGAKRSCYSKTQ